MAVVLFVIVGCLGYSQVQINSIERSYEVSDATRLEEDIASEALLKVDDSAFIPVESHSRLIIGEGRTDAAGNYLSELNRADTGAGVARGLRMADKYSPARKLKGTAGEFVSPDDIRSLERLGGEPRDIGAFVDPSTLY